MAEVLKREPPGGPLLCPILIGRDRHLASVNRLLDEAGGGKGQALFLRGEAGIGKSRLVGEGRSMALRRGFLVLEGRCFEPDRPLPYAPLRDLLRTFFMGRSPQEMSQVLGTAAPELIKLTPELSPLLPGVTATPALEPEQEKHRLFQALLQVLVSQAAMQPTLIVVEDLQWSDDVSLDFLLYLTRRIESQPMLLLLTYRHDEIHPALSRFLVELDRQRLNAEIALAPLTKEEVDAMIRAIFEQPRPVEREFLDAIYTLTEGNPFFVEEVLKSLVEAGGIFYADGMWDRKPVGELPIPRSAEHAVRRRVDDVSEPARRLLALAAVAGRRFDFALLKHLTKSDETSLLDLIKELIAGQFVIEESAERFAFRHALTRQAIHSQLLARERRALHQTIAETLEGGVDTSSEHHLEDLAYHFYEAAVWTKALGYCERAGEKALRLSTPRAAILHLTRAFEAAHQLAVPPTRGLYRCRAEAYEMMGEFNPALADREAVLEIARGAGERGAECEALLDLGLLWASRDYEKAGECYQKALQIAHETGDTPLLAQALNRAGNWSMNAERPIEALQHHQQALTIFQRSQDRRGMAATLELLGMTNIFVGDLLQSASCYREALTLHRQAGDRQGMIACLAALSLCGAGYHTDSLVAASPLGEATKDAELALTMAQEIGWRPAESLSLWNLACCLGPRGLYVSALDCAERAFNIAEEIEHRQWMTAAHWTLGALYLDLFALPGARLHLEQALLLAKEIGSENWKRCAAGCLASACILDGALTEAESLLDAFLRSNLPMETMGQRLCWSAKAELALACCNPTLALEIVDRLIASTANPSEGRVVPRLWNMRGEALTALKRVEEAEIVLHSGKEAALTQGARSVLWRIHHTLGKLYESQSRDDEARQAFMVSRAMIEEVAATIPEDREIELREVFLRRAASLLPHSLPVSRRRVARQPIGGLTPRECDVAALLAEGKSNREIADALVVGERTVETHVSNILSKLGFASRGEITTWVVARGLAENRHS